MSAAVERGISHAELLEVVEHLRLTLDQQAEGLAKVYGLLDLLDPAVRATMPPDVRTDLELHELDIAALWAAVEGITERS